MAAVGHNIVDLRVIKDKYTGAPRSDHILRGRDRHTQGIRAAVAALLQQTCLAQGSHVRR